MKNYQALIEYEIFSHKISLSIVERAPEKEIWLAIGGENASTSNYSI
jgi:hypothetical protein